MKRASYFFFVALLMGFFAAPAAMAQLVGGIDPGNIDIFAQIRILDMTLGVVDRERHVTNMVAEITNLNLPLPDETNNGSNDNEGNSQIFKGAVKFLEKNAKEISMSVQLPSEKVRPLDSYAANKWGPWKGLIKANVRIHVLAMEVTPVPGKPYSCVKYIPIVTDLNITEAPVNPHQPCLSTVPAPTQDSAPEGTILPDPETAICVNNCRVITEAVGVYNRTHEPMTVLDQDVLVRAGCLKHPAVCHDGGKYSLVVHPTAGSWCECSFHSKINY